MIRIKPIIETPQPLCPDCGTQMETAGFLIPGMRNLADFRCPRCDGEFYGDLPSGQGLFTPILINKSTGKTHDDSDVGWFADWLSESYRNRQTEALGFEVRQISGFKDKAVLLNCLDVLYGHSLLKLLNAQYYIDFQPDFSLIVLVPRFLEWMVPEGASAVWVVDLPLRSGTMWNDWLAGEIRKRLQPISEVFLSMAFAHPHPNDFDIERFTQICPFALENFDLSSDTPAVTFIWREDRLWESMDRATSGGLLSRFSRPTSPEKHMAEQEQRVINFAGALRSEFPLLDFAVAGFGQAGRFPPWISDLRFAALNAETERTLCARYAKSHIVVGVHGSNMLLPSAHAGSVIELIGEDRQGNYLQDILFSGGDGREVMFRYRFVPPSSTPKELADLASTMLRYADFRRLMSPEFCRHRDNHDFERWRMRSRQLRKPE